MASRAPALAKQFTASVAKIKAAAAKLGKSAVLQRFAALTPDEIKAVLWAAIQKLRPRIMAMMEASLAGINSRTGTMARAVENVTIQPLFSAGGTIGIVVRMAAGVKYPGKKGNVYAAVMSNKYGSAHITQSHPDLFGFTQADADEIAGELEAAIVRYLDTGKVG